MGENSIVTPSEDNAHVQWLPVVDGKRIKRFGRWDFHWLAHTPADALVTYEDGAALEFSFSGLGLILRLSTLTPPNYSGLESGQLEIFIDGKKVQTIYPRSTAREIVLARNLLDKEHHVRVIHRGEDELTGCAISGFWIIAEKTGDLSFTISGDHNISLIDARAVLMRNGRVIRNTLVRNWLTGKCRLAGLPPGDDYVLELRAVGWKSWQKEGISIKPGQETELEPVYLHRKWDNVRWLWDFVFPRTGHPIVSKAGNKIRARFLAYSSTIGEFRLVRRIGPAIISRTCDFEEDEEAGFYYYKEGTVSTPNDLPPGLYDLVITFSDSGRSFDRILRRSVYIVSDYPKNPTFMTFGHLNTWGQNQAEYLSRMVEIANIIAPDMVLIANACNPAYVSGALYGLDMPFVVTFGNHQLPGKEVLFGDPVGIVDFGPHLSILNFGHSWDADISHADRLLADREEIPCKIINAFEHNAPVKDFLDRHNVKMIHDAHGPGRKIMKIGATPTLRVGKVDESSFRIVRFKDYEPVSYTYKGDDVAPIPFNRDDPTPVRVNYEPANGGKHSQVTAHYQNDLEEHFPNARLVFILPKGNYRAKGGYIESEISSDDLKYSILSVRFDLPAKKSGVIEVLQVR